MRAPGCPQGAFVEELMLDEIAHRCGIDPLALRRRLDDSERRGAMYDVAARLIGWSERPDTGSQDGPMRTGYGIATCDWGKGRAPAKIEVEVRFDRSMGTIHRYEFTTEVDGKVAVIGAVAVSLSGSQS